MFEKRRGDTWIVFGIQKEKTLYEKLSILSDAAKYDVACTSSGTQRRGDGTGIGNCEKAGICHQFYAGRTVRLPLKDPVYQ